MRIQITDKFQVFHDGFQWRVSEYKEGGIIPVGKYAGQMSEPKWVDLEKFYPHCNLAIKYILAQEICEDNSTVTIEEFKEYLEDYFEKCKNHLNVKTE